MNYKHLLLSITFLLPFLFSSCSTPTKANILENQCKEIQSAESSLKHSLKCQGTNFVYDLIIKASKRPHKSIKWLAIGDSFTEINDQINLTDNRITKGYMTRVCEKFPQLTYENRGYSGITFAGQAERTFEKDFDIYTILLGTNDWDQDMPLGTLENFKDKEPGTILGSFGILYEKVAAAANGSPILIMTPIHRGVYVHISHKQFYKQYHDTRTPNNAGYTMKELADKIIECCKYKNIPYLDLFRLSGITPNNAMQYMHIDTGNGEYKNLSYPAYDKFIQYDKPFSEHPYTKDAIWCLYDGLHPSDIGMEIIANLLYPEMCKLIWNN